MGGCRFDNTRLDGARLNGAYAERARFNESVLRDGRLRGAKLKMAEFFRSDLSGADLQDCQLEGAKFIQCSLARANLAGSLLTGTNFSHSNLDGVRLERAVLDPGTDLSSLKSFSGPYLLDVVWNAANLSTVNWNMVGWLGEERDARMPTTDSRRKPRTLRAHEFELASRANAQLAAALRDRGLRECDGYTYRSRLLQTHMQRWQGRLPSYILSLAFDWISGYGYKPGRAIMTYAFTILLFMAAYQAVGKHGIPADFVQSVTAFHGRGFGASPSSGSIRSIIAAVEAMVGLFVEVVLVASFTRRIFGA